MEGEGSPDGPVRHGTPGFRISATDVAFLVAAAILGAAAFVAAAWLPAFGDLLRTVGVLVLYVPATFFLYCNVFRVGRRREYLWVAWFLANCLASVLAVGELRLAWVLPAGIAATVVIIATEMRRGDYHGVRLRRRGR